MKKKLSVIMLCIAMLFITGCGGSDEPEYPSLGDAVEIENAQESSHGGFTAQYDSEKWVFDNSLGLFTIADKETYASEAKSCNNINAIVSEAYEGPFSKEDMDALMKEMKSSGPAGFEIKKNELKTFLGEPVIYYETETSITDEMLDILVKNGNLTEELITQAGGREALKASAASRQVAICAIIDKNIVILTGTYYDDGDKGDIIETMKCLIKTGKVK